tara:strand:- start:2711 stop:3085 length:375 start_codon:yes stop_codon:yes gene_type:complete
MQKTAAGPDGTKNAGQEYEVSDDEAQALVDAAAATWVNPGAAATDDAGAGDDPAADAGEPGAGEGAGDAAGAGNAGEFAPPYDVEKKKSKFAVVDSKGETVQGGLRKWSAEAMAKELNEAAAGE